jgi:hypothetical protein
MSGNLSTVLLPAPGVGAQAVIGQLPIGVADTARATLPYTGFALGVYLGLALTLLLVGFVLRLVGGARGEGT